MASGFGVYTKTGRCYEMWQLYSSCQLSSNAVEKCQPAFEDYFECVHGVKEKTWVRRVEQKILAKRQEYAHQQSAPTTTTTTDVSHSKGH